MAELYLDGKSVSLKNKVPLVPLKETVVFPGTALPISVGRQRSKTAVDAAAGEDGLAIFVCQKNARIEVPGVKDLYEVGTIAKIRRIWKMNGDYNLVIEGLSRVRIVEFIQTEPYIAVKVEEIPEVTQKSDEEEALVRTITNQIRRYGEVGGLLTLEASIAIFSSEDPNRLVDSIAGGIDFEATRKQYILETVDLTDRLSKISEMLAHEIKVLEIGQQISSETQKRVNKMAEEAILREQMRSIEKRLGEDEEEREFDELAKKIKASKMPADIQVKAEKELKRLSRMSSANPEASYIRTYLEWLIELPWVISTAGKRIDLKKASKILDEDHYGLKKVKERILEYLAVHKLAGKVKGPILCFAGPPGTGKTSIGKSIARALDRKFVKVSLGGIHDEAEIRGHRRTYVGSMPGRIIQGIKNAGSRDPIFMLDEIDKIGIDFRGDPSAALLEALDPEQNNAFSDHYLEVSFDLSHVMFITTANILDTIPPALRDRLEVIEFPGYTEEEKFHIVQEFILHKQIESHGLKKSQISISEKALKTIINRYTREAGVRNLERQIAAICRKVARRLAENKIKKATITEKNLPQFLGPAKFTSMLAEQKDEIGIATGLAWTPAGGDILFIEVALMPGKGGLLLTGQLGDVMKESAQAAVSYIRSRAEKFGLLERFAQKLDIHVHVPEGAVPKDGPSAGVSITCALVSALTRIPSRKDVAMTGEVTLRGRVLEIGGVKEKVLAAHRAGVKTVILPFENKKDLEDIPKNIQKALKFVFVKHVDEVLDMALSRKLGGKSGQPVTKKISRTHRDFTPVFPSVG